MSALDLRTVVLTGLGIGIVCTGVLATLWRQARNRYDGLGLWTLDFCLQTIGLAMIVARGSIPDWISIYLSNTLILAGVWIGLLGLERFVGRRSPQLLNILLLGAAFLIHALFFWILPNLTVRSLSIAAALLILSAQCAWLMLARVEASLRPATRWVGFIFAAYSAIFATRIVGLLAHPFRSADYFLTGSAEAGFYLLVQSLFILLTYALGLMINRRLLAAIRLQEEKFSKAFHGAPYAILLTRLSDGKILEVNDGFAAITGHSPHDALAKTTTELHLWDRAEDRADAVARLAAQGRVDPIEAPFHKKSGEPFIGRYSASILAIGAEPCVLSIIDDITARKRAEAERERLLTERENSLAEIKVLSGLLPICASCKKIRDDKGYWNQIESYIRSHSQAEFSHGLCPDCARRLYPNHLADPPPPRTPPPKPPPSPRKSP